ncbi:MAG: hypothetical protein AB1324_00920 [Candidatus Micrarchaeota archaeon]
MPLVLELWQGWLWFAGFTLGFTTVLAALVYMLSELLQNEKMKGWAKLELSEVFYSVLIISMVLVGLPLVDNVVQGAITGAGTGGGNAVCGASPLNAWVRFTDTGTFGSTQTYRCVNLCATGAQDVLGADEHSVYHGVDSCHMRLGIYYLRELFDETKTFIFSIYSSYIETSMIAEFTINIEFLFERAGFFTFTPWKGFYSMGNKVKELVFDWGIKLMMITKFQEVMLRFIATALFPALFIVGVLLRTFPFSRKLGGLLLGMALALYFIFPAFYAFGALIMLSIKGDAIYKGSWLTNTTANPLGQDNPNPPIANVMYHTDTIFMPGGSGNYTTAQMQERLRYYENLDSRSYYQYMEQGQGPGGERLMPGFDLTSTEYAGRSEADQNNTLRQARESADNWFNSVSRESKIDSLINFAW